MLKSRALPDDFDMSQALHSPYTNFPPSANEQILCPGNYHQGKESLITGPAFAGGLKHYIDEYTPSPLTATSPWDSYFPPHSVPTSRDDMSPTGRLPEVSPDELHPYMRSASYPGASQPLWNAPPLLARVGDTLGRARIESLASPHGNGPYMTAPLSHGVNSFSIEPVKDRNSPLDAATSPPSLTDNERDGLRCEKPG